MNTKMRYKPDAAELARASVRIAETTIHGHTVTIGTEVTVERTGLATGDYEVIQLERLANGDTLLTVYGPLRTSRGARGRKSPGRNYINATAVTDVVPKGGRKPAPRRRRGNPQPQHPQPSILEQP